MDNKQIIFGWKARLVQLNDMERFIGMQKKKIKSIIKNLRKEQRT